MNTRKFLYAVIASYVTAVFMSMIAMIVSINISTREARDTDIESNRRWCELLVTLDEAYSKVPPNTPVGMNIAAHIHNLRVDFNCEEHKNG